MFGVVCDLGFPFWFVLFPVIGLLIRWKWGVEVARREEIKRLVAAAYEEAARAEREAAAGYRNRYASGYGVGSSNWVDSGSDSSSPESAARLQRCVVCFTATTNRCSRCKAVWYCVELDSALGILLAYGLSFEETFITWSMVNRLWDMVTGFPCLREMLQSPVMPIVLCLCLLLVRRDTVPCI
ncbi:Ubiquitin carboxyl-terminal hydrolase 17-like protein [Drosera capensis]